MSRGYRKISSFQQAHRFARLMPEDAECLDAEKYGSAVMRELF
jgi:hypothetical protein